AVVRDTRGLLSGFPHCYTLAATPGSSEMSGSFSWVRARILGGPAGRCRGRRDDSPPVMPPAESVPGAVTGFDRFFPPVTACPIDASLWRDEGCFLGRRARGPPPPVTASFPSSVRGRAWRRAGPERPSPAPPARPPHTP